MANEGTAPQSDAASLVSVGTPVDANTFIFLLCRLNPTIGYWDPLGLAGADFWNQGDDATVGFLRQAEVRFLPCSARASIRPSFLEVTSHLLSTIDQARTRRYGW